VLVVVVAGVVAAVEVVGVVAGVLVVVAVVPLEELPQPASASRPRTTDTAESTGSECFFARACA
jgi:hypothetical protein